MDGFHAIIPIFYSVPIPVLVSQNIYWILINDLRGTREIGTEIAELQNCSFICIC